MRNDGSNKRQADSIGQKRWELLSTRDVKCWRGLIELLVKCGARRVKSLSLQCGPTRRRGKWLTAFAPILWENLGERRGRARTRSPAVTAWHLPDRPVGPASRWAATSNVEVRSKDLYPVSKVGMEGREKSERESHEEDERGWVNGTGEEFRGPLLGRDSFIRYLEICAGVSEFPIS